MPNPMTGGCQCGAVRFRVDGPVGRASICHCRMCQKATGGFFGPYVSAHGVTWTRGEPKRFASSNRVRRGFCGECGTTLTFEYSAEVTELAIGAFDDPTPLAPVIQMELGQRLPWFEDLAGLPTRTPAEQADYAKWSGAIVSNQHPDHDTDAWPPVR
ncbi:MAG TPA: GFA family protein [Caulobacteraceae bacterium]|nr:GFA family protein [Caulobacteraceae bacterium]